MAPLETDLLLANLPGLAYRCEPAPPWKMQYVSKGAKALCGFDPEDLISGRVSWERITHPGDVAMVDDGISAAIAERRPFDLIYRIVDREGVLKWVHEKGEAVGCGQDRPDALVGFIMGVTVADLTTSRDAKTMVADEAALRRSVEVEMRYRSGQSAMAGLAGTIAHELNQPLAAISIYAATLRHLLSDASDHARDIVDAVQSNAVRAADILRRLRSFVETGRPRMQPVAFNDLVAEAVDFARTECGQAQIGLDLGVPAVALVDRVQIQQVLVNLVRNACEATAAVGAGRIRIRTTVETEPVRLQVSVRNNGPPIAEDMLQAIFEAGRSSKPEGMGIGLSISRTIVEAHGGTIWADRRDDGAQISFQLPLVPELPDRQ